MESLIIFVIFAVFSALRAAAEQQKKQTKKMPDTTPNKEQRPALNLPSWLTELTEGVPVEKKRPTADAPGQQRRQWPQPEPVKASQQSVSKPFEPTSHYQEKTLTPAAPLKVKSTAESLQIPQVWLKDLDEVRRGIVMAEILGKPKALRTSGRR